MIKMQAIGHLGAEAKINQVNGKSVINFSVAHTEKFKDAQGQQKEKTLWIECAYWSDRTGIAQYLVKGQQVFVDGQPDVRMYTGKDGRQGASLILRVSSIQLVGGTKGGEDKYSSINNQTARSYGNANVTDNSDPVDELPF